MANTVVCPSCHGAVGVSGSFSGGLIACPQCQHQFVVTAPALRGPRPSSGRPELLDRLPRTLVNTTGFRAAAAGGVLVYGIGLALAMSSLKANPSSYEFHPDPLPPITAALTGSTPPVAPTPAPSATPGQPAPAPSPQVAKVDAAPKPPDKPPEPAPPPKPAPPARVQLTLDALGGLIDPVGDCQLAKDAKGLTISVPAKLHLLSPELNLKTSPRSIVQVEGDFDARVSLPGTIKPSKDPVGNFPLSFQGGGLLVWQDENSFLRLEKSAATANGRNFSHNVMVEACKDGMPADNAYAEVPDGTMALRLERIGNEFTCSYSADGQAWTELKKIKVDYLPRVGLGLSASNTSRKPFAPRFEAFALSATAKP